MYSVFIWKISCSGVCSKAELWPRGLAGLTDPTDLHAVGLLIGEFQKCGGPGESEREGVFLRDLYARRHCKRRAGCGEQSIP